jgi:transcriptional regulator with XRE-family HTH domain
VDRIGLADFLRRRREALQPSDVGLGPGLRRRTAGLRREEVAGLAGMSGDYYGRLEQRRGSQPSESILAGLARALRLTLDERDHLYRLAGYNAPARDVPSDHVNPALLRILDRLDPTPAQVISDLGETLAQNRLAVALLGDHSGYTGLARSSIYRWFADPSARRVYPESDHDWHTRSMVANLRAAHVRRGRDARSSALVGELYRLSEEFRARWDEHQVEVRRAEHKRIVHPELGVIELDCQTLLAESQSQVLLVFTAPAGSEGAEQLRLLSVIGSQRFS